MPSSLSDRLRALGVQIGPSELKPKPSFLPHRLSEVLGGQFEPTPFGEAFVVTQTYPEGSSLGDSAIQVSSSLEKLALWAGDPNIARAQTGDLVFLDTETTGLAGGTGTYPFLIGAGRFIDGEFVLKQFFMPDPSAEAAQLAAFESFLALGSTLVSFNGKAFDAPLINTRYILQGQQTPLRGMAHIDLLHLSRRLWRDRLPSRTLGNLEVQILGASRTDMDIPGWLIPQIYFDYLRDGDPTPLKNVLYHNGQDVVSLAALLNHTAGMLQDPVGNGGRYGSDLIALARLFEDLGDLEHAAQLYLHGLDHADSRSGDLPAYLLLQALQRLALIRKRQNELETAVELWQQAANRRHLESHIELAKCFEHHLLDLPQALEWTNAAIRLLEAEDASLVTWPELNSLQKMRLLGDLRHRQERLLKKMGQGS